MPSNTTKISRQKRKDPPQPRGVKNGLLPAFPCSYSFIGLSRSGKTFLMKKVLTDKNLMGGFFHTILVFSPTASCDSTLFEELDIPDENVYTSFTEDDLKEILEARKKQIEKKGYNWVAKNNRMLFIIDDCISHQRFLKSQTIIDLTATSRHYLCSVFFAIQSLNKVVRSARVNLRGIVYFQSNANELEVLLNENRPPNLDRESFRRIIHHATKDKYGFLFINRDSPFKDRYRKGFDTILEIEDSDSDDE